MAFDLEEFVPRLRGTVHGMEVTEAIDRIVDLLDHPGESSVNTSMRLPASLREAAALAVEHLGTAPSTTTLTIEAIRRTLEAEVMAAALEAHYDAHPHARPTLAELALALAEQDGSPLMSRAELIEQAAAEVAARRPDADAFDVLLWAEARQIGAGHTSP